LSFLLMIGFSLVAEGFGFHIPKGYLYAAIGFSVMIEALNQLATTIMKQIASASEDQSKGISQVGVAITQMDSVTQQNAALVEQV
ncbi:hypothetical protein MJM59_32210, partial [Salmonella enterica subsp. enterica serovar Montevideo]|nr:hypothetical protein [Salmonella enterica subsp. enterica serovar Montevideo]